MLAVLCGKFLVFYIFPQSLITRSVLKTGSSAFMVGISGWHMIATDSLRPCNYGIDDLRCSRIQSMSRDDFYRIVEQILICGRVYIRGKSSKALAETLQARGCTVAPISNLLRPAVLVSVQHFECLSTMVSCVHAVSWC